MIDKVVTFDAAGTLIHVDWNPARLAVDAVEGEGLELNRQVAEETYTRLLQTEWASYQLLNGDGDFDACREFWVALTKRWVGEIGLPEGLAPVLVLRVEERMYSKRGGVYRVYDDVFPVLEELKAKGVRMAVISNWDFTLEATLIEFGLRDYFEVVVASLVFGIEKPEKAIFDYTLDQMKVEAESVIHVGDDPLTDLGGARGAGMKGVLIDRGMKESEGSRIANMGDLVGIVLGDG